MVWLRFGVYICCWGKHSMWGNMIIIHDGAFKWHLRSIDYCVFLFFWCTSFNTVGKLFTFASLFKLCWQKAEKAKCFIYLVSFYEFKCINTVLNIWVILCVWVLTVFKLVYYYDKYKCFVFYIVLECVLNHNVVCDVIWIKSVIESLLAFELTLVSLSCSSTCVFNICVLYVAYEENDALLYTFRQCSLK